MTSAVLFHGPLARERALEYAQSEGRLLHDPFGEDGLKIAESREIIELMNGTPLGDQVGVIVVGPMDRALPASTDVLLKTLEEFDPRVFRPVLWAYDEGGVRPTIRSRCVRRWCPGDEIRDEELLSRVAGLVEASLSQDRPAVLSFLRETTGPEVLLAASQVLRDRGVSLTAKELGLWERVREALRVRNPSVNEIKAVFL